MIELIQRMMNAPGTEPLTLEERAQLTEAIRRRDAWMVFVEYHEHAMWAREDAERKIEENAYLPPEAVDYMKGEIKRRAGRKALLAALEAEDGNSKTSQTAGSSDKPDAGRDAANHRGASGEGKGGARETEGTGSAQTQAVEPDTSPRTPTSDAELARELLQVRRGHEGKPASDSPAEKTYGAIDGKAYGVGGKSEGP